MKGSVKPAGKKETECHDPRCPIHSSISIRGKIFTGVVTAMRMQRTATVEWERKKYLKKYERYTKTRTRVYAHIPWCMKIELGDIVEVGETKPLSKIKKFVILGKKGYDLASVVKSGVKEEDKERVEKSSKKGKEHEGRNETKIEESPKKESTAAKSPVEEVEEKGADAKDDAKQ